MAELLTEYEKIVGPEVIDQLRQLAKLLAGMNVVHVNSTKEGGGVAEILHRIIPLKNELGLTARWEVITGDRDFYQCTKLMHNALQGNRVNISGAMLKNYEKTAQENAERLREVLEGADMVFIHDPQPAALIRLCNARRGKWIWRCHIDVSHPYRGVWKYLREHIKGYDASIWSLSEYVQPLPHPLYLIAPSIDPLSSKNIKLSDEDLAKTRTKYGLDPSRPIITQVSRFDRFKDPIGVIHSYRLVKEFLPLQLVLAGGGATDDPEGEEVLAQVRSGAEGDPDIHVLLLPPDDHLTINALQRISDIVLQKSTREGFGLTVTEAMWKGKPVIGGDTGGIRLQVINHHTGFLVNTPEGAALRIRYLLKRRDKLLEMGSKARQFVLENFLITRHLREYLTLMVAVMFEHEDRIEPQ
ncbi:MAG TPA: glycosyltransferase [Deltaproteobacteria bacterium]|nr:glycosyltransferase [Deltaproteobacteria bacterium]HPJ93569.1 glycosyltransferase [Deltaproteobacteria bacterium]HPR50491.1 glycosyltransferase [Deltaproteobacteria bacterium]